MAHPVQHLWIPGQVPGLNELVEARVNLGHTVGQYGKRWSGYSDLKRDYEHKVVLLARCQQLRPVSQAYCTYLFYERDKRRDPSNFVGGGIKLIEDGLRKAEILPDDGWDTIRGFTQWWDVDKDDPGVAVFLSKLNTLDRSTAIFSDHKARKKE